jgi:hypothetical protein
MPVAQYKGEDHARHRSNRTDNRSDDDAFAVLLEQPYVRLCLPLLRFQDQIAVESPSEIAVRFDRHQDALKVLGQIEQPLNLLVPGPILSRRGTWIDQLFGMCC